jgi:glycosyltransferase involved in cell wall biosynthesis
MALTSVATQPALASLTRSARRRVCVLGEALSGAPDEGVKKLALALASSMAREHDVSMLSTEGETPLPGGRVVPAPRTFLSADLRRELARHEPEILLYVARPSTTFASFLRARLLKLYCPRALVVLVGLQARRHSRIQQAMIRLLAPDLVCVQSAESKRYLESLGCTVSLLPSGVDVETFRPVVPGRRRALRARYGLRQDAPVVLHVGHLQAGRGIRVLADMAASDQCQVVLVASSSTAQEADLAEELRRSGVIVRTDYQPHIEHYYQLADCYAFPVASTNHSIEVPLSVLEAFACDLPVVTRRFGGLPRLFGGRSMPGLSFVDSPGELIDEALRLCRDGPGGTRPLALPYAWDAVATSLIEGALLVTEKSNA